MTLSTWTTELCALAQTGAQMCGPLAHTCQQSSACTGSRCSHASNCLCRCVGRCWCWDVSKGCKTHIGLMHGLCACEAGAAVVHMPKHTHTTGAGASTHLAARACAVGSKGCYSSPSIHMSAGVCSFASGRHSGSSAQTWPTHSAHVRSLSRYGPCPCMIMVMYGRAGRGCVVFHFGGSRGFLLS
jgi:hypothetical protein